MGYLVTGCADAAGRWREAFQRALVVLRCDTTSRQSQINARNRPVLGRVSYANELSRAKARRQSEGAFPQKHLV